MPSLLPRHQLWSIKKSARSVEIADQTGFANEAALRFALADGTSPSPQARAWSQILARHACRIGMPRNNDLMRWLSGAHEAWQGRFQRRSKLWTQPDLPELGAAALCLVELHPAEGGFRWSALLQGDVCLFHIRDARTIRRLPMEHSRDFGQNKPCFFSEPIALNHQPAQLTANATVGDVLVMASEPLARWIYAQLELGHDPWPELLALPDDSAFASLVNRERAASRMRDDDTALMFIRTNPLDDSSILDAPTRSALPGIPPLRPSQPPEYANPSAASDYEDIFELELLQDTPSPDDLLSADLGDELGLQADLELLLNEDVLHEDLSDDSMSEELSREESAGTDGLFLDLPEVEQPPAYSPAPEEPMAEDHVPEAVDKFYNHEELNDELLLFADNEGMSRPRPTILSEEMHQDAAALDDRQFRIPLDEIPADVFDSVTGSPFSDDEEDFDVLEALDDMDDSDDDIEETHEMSFFTPAPIVDNREPPALILPRRLSNHRPVVAVVLLFLIGVLAVASLIQLARLGGSGAIERVSLRMDRMEATLAGIQSERSTTRSGALGAVGAEAVVTSSAFTEITTRVEQLESHHTDPPPEATAPVVVAAPAVSHPQEPIGAAPIPEGKPNSPMVAVAPAKKKKPAPAKKKRPVASSSASQIPASAPSTAWIGCPPQVCTRSGGHATLRSVTPVWASPYSGDRVAVLASGRYTILNEEDVGGYLWLEVRLK